MPTINSYENVTVSTTDEILATRNGVAVNVSVGSMATQNSNAVSITGGTIAIAPITLTSSSGSVAWDLSAGQNAKHAATENTTLANPTNMTEGGEYTFIWTQHASSAKTLAFGSAFRPAANMPLVSTGASAVDIFTFRSDGTRMFLVGSAQNIGT